MSTPALNNIASSDDDCNWLEQLFSSGLQQPSTSHVEHVKDERKCKKKAKDRASRTTRTPKSHDNWLGYLVFVFIDETFKYSQECCPGCNNQKSSPLLHAHHQSGLLEKLVMFHPLIKESMLSKMTPLVKHYVELFPDPELYDEVGQKTLKTFGRDFLMQSSPTFIYYSHYLTPECEKVICGTPQIHIKPMNLKRFANRMGKMKQPSKKRQKKGDGNEESTI